MKLNKFVGAQIKRTAQNCYPLTRRINKINETIKQLQEEYDDLNNQWHEYQVPIMRLTNGYTTDDLVDRVTNVTGKDKNGNPIKTTSYVLKYPDTIIPPQEVIQSQAPTTEEEAFDVHTEETPIELLAGTALPDELAEETVLSNMENSINFPE